MVKTKRFAASLVTAAFLGAAAPAPAEDAPLAVQIVDALNKVYGAHPGYRANHAKGIVVEGHFKATPEAAKLSRAKLFDGSAIPVTVRFSDAGGVPTIPDGDPNANPHGMAIKYHLPGGDTDMVIVSLHFFPVATGEDFRDLLLAIADSPKDAPHPNKLEQFLAAHPQAPKAFATTATPYSFAHEEFYGIDAFNFVDAAGNKQAVRYRMVPEKLVHLKPDIAPKMKPDFLAFDLRRRLDQKPVTFHLKAQLAAPGDQTRDPSQPWPEDRRLVDLGTLTLDKVVPDSAAAEKKLLFTPTSLTDGIELTDDPLPLIRTSAYAVSFSRRQQ
jgi:catalase